MDSEVGTDNNSMHFADRSLEDDLVLALTGLESSGMVTGLNLLAYASNDTRP
jgi:hypothetical protein